MTSTDLRRIHAVTDNFFFWQGLRWVPLGIAMIVTALAFSPSLGLPAVIREWAGIPVMIVALWLSSSVLGRYYARNFGRVRTEPGRHTTRSTVKWFIIYPAVIGAMIADGILKPPVMLSALVFAVSIEAYRESTGGGRLHYIGAAIVVAALALLPLFGVIAPGKEALGALIAIIGAIYAVGGVLDHRELVRVLGTANGASDAGAI